MKALPRSRLRITLSFALVVALSTTLLDCARRSEERPVAAEDPVVKWAALMEPSTESLDQRIAELRWFRDAAKDLGGVKVKSTAENIETHYWESRVLARAFHEITGIE